MDPKLRKALIRGWIVGSSFYLIALTVTGGFVPSISAATTVRS